MKQLFLILALAFSLNAYSQDIKNVTLVVSGQGKTQEEAKQNALRSAIEQAFGTFVSSRTEILNDELIKDQIVSVANGNIQKFEVLSSLYLEEQTLHLVTLNAIVSIDKLTSFVQSKGYNDISFDGGGFTMNLKLQKFNATSEIVAIQNLLEQGLSLSKDFFDRELQVGNPSLITSNEGAEAIYKIPLSVSSTLNSNWNSYYEYYKKTLKSIAMTNEEIATYTGLNKPVYLLVFVNVTSQKRREGKKFELLKIADSLTFRTTDALKLLTSFQILLNAKYLDDVQVIHALDTINLDIQYEAKYRIATRGDNKNIINIWYVEDLPFESLDRFVFSGRGNDFLIYEYRYQQENKILPIFNFSFKNFCDGYRIDEESFKDHEKYFSSIWTSSNLQSNLNSLMQINQQLFVDNFYYDYSDWQEAKIIKKRFEIISKIGSTYSVNIDVGFTESDLEQIRGFKLLK